MFDRKAFLAVMWVGIAAVITGCERRTEAQAATASAATPATTSAAAPPAAAVSGDGAWFVETGCAKCHAVSVYGVTPEAQIGPDLSIAVEDVKTRFGVPIEEFLDNPSGTMALVLSSQIQLTPEQKKLAVEKLHAAYAAHQKAGGLAASH